MADSVLSKEAKSRVQSVRDLQKAYNTALADRKKIDEKIAIYKREFGDMMKILTPAEIAEIQVGKGGK